MKQAHSSRYISIYYSCSTAPPAPAPAPTPQLRLPLRQVAPHAAEPKTKRKWPAVPRATRTKRKIPAAGRSRYALPSRRIQHREEIIIRETEDRREQREARGGSAPCTSPCWSQRRPCCRRTSRSRMLTSWVQPTKFRVACARAVWANALHTSNSGSVRHWNAG